MKLICNNVILENVIMPFQLEILTQEQVLLHAKMVVNEQNQFYVQYGTEYELTEFFILELKHGDILKLDKLQSTISLRKEKVKIVGHSIEFSEEWEDEIFIYVRRNDETQLDGVNFQCVLNNITKSPQNNRCDIYLLIPGALERKEFDDLPNLHSELFEHFSLQMKTNIEQEYDSDFFQKVRRKCLGEVVLHFYDVTEKREVFQKALVGIALHPTGYCIVEIFVQNCYVGGNKLLNYYCGNGIEILYKGATYDIDAFFDAMGISRYGKKKSVVFADDSITDKEMIVSVKL